MRERRREGRGRQADRGEDERALQGDGGGGQTGRQASRQTGRQAGGKGAWGLVPCLVGDPGLLEAPAQRLALLHEVVHARGAPIFVHARPPPPPPRATSRPRCKHHIRLVPTHHHPPPTTQQHRHTMGHHVSLVLYPPTTPPPHHPPAQQHRHTMGTPRSPRPANPTHPPPSNQHPVAQAHHGNTTSASSCKPNPTTQQHTYHGYTMSTSSSYPQPPTNSAVQAPWEQGRGAVQCNAAVLRGRWGCWEAYLTPHGAVGGVAVAREACRCSGTPPALWLLLPVMPHSLGYWGRGDDGTTER